MSAACIGAPPLWLLRPATVEPEYEPGQPNGRINITARAWVIAIASLVSIPAVMDAKSVAKQKLPLKVYNRKEL